MGVSFSLVVLLAPFGNYLIQDSAHRSLGTVVAQEADGGARASFVKQYLEAGEIIVAEIARYSGDLSRVFRDQYSPI